MFLLLQCTSLFSSDYYKVSGLRRFLASTCNIRAPYTRTTPFQLGWPERKSAKGVGAHTHETHPPQVTRCRERGVGCGGVAHTPPSRGTRKSLVEGGPRGHALPPPPQTPVPTSRAGMTLCGCMGPPTMSPFTVSKQRY